MLPALPLLLALHASAATLIRGPYLEGVSAASAFVCWRTDGPTVGALELRRTGAEVRRVDDPEPVRQHCVEAELPGGGRGYEYRVGYRAGRDAWVWTSTRPLAAVDPPGAPIVFAVFGDSGDASHGQALVGRRLSEARPLFVLLAGDVIYPGGSDVDYGPKYFDPYAGFLDRAPVFIAIGNHDYNNTTRRKGAGLHWVRDNFFQVHRLPRQRDGGAWRPVEAGRTYYSFDWGPVHVAAIDTNQVYPIPAAPPIDPQSAQWRWLDADLAASTAPWKIVFMHIGLYTNGMHGTSPELVRWLAPLFERRGVDVAFQGHDHDYERSTPIVDGRPAERGPVYVTCGIGGATLRGRTSSAPWSAAFASRYGYVRVEADARRLALKAVGADGAAFDEWETVKRP